MRHFRARTLARLGTLGILLAVAAATASAQQEVAVAAPKQPEVPFVSRLSAVAADGAIRLTWKDSPDVVGTCLVYRSTAEITGQTLSASTLAGSVASGVQSFTDTPPDQGAYYYAVIMQDASGVRYALAIPFRNVTTAGVAAKTAAAPVEAPAEVPGASPPPEVTASVAPAPSPQTAAAQAAPTPASPAPAVVAAAPAVTPVPARSAATDTSTPAQITGIAAAVSPEGDSVTVTFRSSNPARDLLLFSSNAPITTAVDLLKSTSTAPLDPGTNRYVLAALPDTSYWFAVMDAGLYKVGQVPLVQGLNATSTPVRAPVRGGTADAAKAARRAQPLPSLDPGFGVQSGFVIGASDAPILPAAKSVSPATEKVIAWLMDAAGAGPAPQQAPTVLTGDTEAGAANSETGQLLSIVQGSFRLNDMSGTQQKLLAFLSLPRAPALEAHARYYLGQSYYFQGQTRAALLEFLQAEDSYYRECQPWIDAALAKLEIEDR